MRDYLYFNATFSTKTRDHGSSSQKPKYSILGVRRRGVNGRKKQGIIYNTSNNKDEFLKNKRDIFNIQKIHLK